VSKIDKGTRVRITAGRAEGVTGSVFWKGENKYGPGERYGVRGDDGETHWVSADQVEASDAPEPEGETFDKGDRVRFQTDGEERTGTVFWTGDNRHGAGQRLGVNPDDGDGRDDAVWLNALGVERLEGDSAPPPPRRSANPYQDGGGSSGHRSDDGVADIPADYSQPVGMDELPPAPPLDDSAADQFAAWAEDDNDPGW
jgi:hypothetical protein